MSLQPDNQTAEKQARICRCMLLPGLFLVLSIVYGLIAHFVPALSIFCSFGAAFLLGCFLMSGVHEVGHKLLGELCGFQIFLLRVGEVGCPAIEFSWGETKVQISLPPFTGQVIEAEPFEGRIIVHSSNAILAYALGGALANFLAFMLGALLALCLWHYEYDVASSFVAGIVAPQLVGLGNLYPRIKPNQRTGLSYWSDGMAFRGPQKYYEYLVELRRVSTKHAD